MSVTEPNGGHPDHRVIRRRLGAAIDRAARSLLHEEQLPMNRLAIARARGHLDGLTAALGLVLDVHPDIALAYGLAGAGAGNPAQTVLDFG